MTAEPIARVINDLHHRRARGSADHGEVRSDYVLTPGGAS